MTYNPPWANEGNSFLCKCMDVANSFSKYSEVDSISCIMAAYLCRQWFPLVDSFQGQTDNGETTLCQGVTERTNHSRNKNGVICWLYVDLELTREEVSII